jgi:nicotinate-nucleotide pyrophosphorylase
MDGEHTAWIIVEVDSKEQARCILPPAFRSQAKIVALNKFTMEQIDEMISQLQR